MKFLLAPDSFKGTMTSYEVCEIMTESLRQRFPTAEIVSIPIADGGEGTVDCFLQAVEGKRITITAKNSFYEDITASYALLHDGKTAILESAVCAGLHWAENRQNPEITTTYGVGQLIAHAVGIGAKEIVIGLGGSCTNDAGCGCLAALGVKFVNRKGEYFIPTGGTLHEIADYDTCEMLDISRCQIVAMCDIENPLFGEQGAAYIFAPQKGADSDMIKRLDQNLRAFAKVVADKRGIDDSGNPGVGAAGGFGFGLAALAGAKLQSGIDTVLERVHWEQQLCGVDCIFTGEGKLDQQSMGGKVISGIVKRTNGDVPVIAVVGDIGDDLGDWDSLGIAAVFSTNQRAIPFDKTRGKKDLRKTMDNIVRMIEVVGKW